MKVNEKDIPALKSLMERLEKVRNEHKLFMADAAVVARDIGLEPNELYERLMAAYTSKRLNKDFLTRNRQIFDDAITIVEKTTSDIAA